MDELRRTLNFAVEKEREAEAFYRSWAAKADEPGVRTLFTQLASWEQGHAEKLASINAEEVAALESPSTGSGLSELLVDIEAAPDMTLQEAFVVAMKREEASAALYRGMAALGGKAGQLFSGLEAEERRHKELLEREYDEIFLPEN